MRFGGCVSAFALVAVTLLPASVRGGDTQTQLKPEANASVKLNHRFRLFLLADLTWAPASWTPGGTDSDTQAELGPHLDITLKPIARPQLRTANWERERYLWARVGYIYSWDPGDAGSAANIGILELTGRMSLPGKVWAVNRGRAELHDKGGTDSARYRYRLTLEKEARLIGVETVPYVSAEVLYDTRYDAWNEQLYRAGMEVVVDARWRLEPYYELTENERSGPRHTNTIGFILKYFR